MGTNFVDRSEAQRVGHADDLRTHAEDVADDAADTGRRALEGNHLRGMIVRFVRGYDGKTLAVVNAEMQDACVFAGAQNHARTASR